MHRARARVPTPARPPHRRAAGHGSTATRAIRGVAHRSRARARRPRLRLAVERPTCGPRWRSARGRTRGASRTGSEAARDHAAARSPHGRSSRRDDVRSHRPARRAGRARESRRVRTRAGRARGPKPASRVCGSRRHQRPRETRPQWSERSTQEARRTVAYPPGRPGPRRRARSEPAHRDARSRPRQSRLAAPTPSTRPGTQARRAFRATPPTARPIRARPNRPRPRRHHPRDRAPRARDTRTCGPATTDPVSRAAPPFRASVATEPFRRECPAGGRSRPRRALGSSAEARSFDTARPARGPPAPPAVGYRHPPSARPSRATPPRAPLRSDVAGGGPRRARAG